MPTCVPPSPSSGITSRAAVAAVESDDSVGGGTEFGRIISSAGGGGRRCCWCGCWYCGYWLNGTVEDAVDGGKDDSTEEEEVNTGERE